MNNVNRTLYIPLYGKALVSRKGIILHDPKAEEIWAKEGFPLKGKSASRWLAYYMGMRASVFDQWVQTQRKLHPDAVVLHLGCGLDSRSERVGAGTQHWFDVDFPAVITERRRYFKETEHYTMLSADIRNTAWLDQIPKGTGIVCIEGVSMYLNRKELLATLRQITTHFEHIVLLMDCYAEFAAKASKIRNPIQDVGVTQVYGLDDPEILTNGTGLRFVKAHTMTPEHLIRTLSGVEQTIFRSLYAGSIAQRMYRLYEYCGDCDGDGAVP